MEGLPEYERVEVGRGLERGGTVEGKRARLDLTRPHTSNLSSFPRRPVSSCACSGPQGLSPHQNRTVPPLRHQWAWALARDFPHLQVGVCAGVAARAGGGLCWYCAGVLRHRFEDSPEGRVVHSKHMGARAVGSRAGSVDRETCGLYIGVMAHGYVLEEWAPVGFEACRGQTGATSSAWGGLPGVWVSGRLR